MVSRNLACPVPYLYLCSNHNGDKDGEFLTNLWTGGVVMLLVTDPTIVFQFEGVDIRDGYFVFGV